MTDVRHCLCERQAPEVQSKGKEKRIENGRRGEEKKKKRDMEEIMTLRALSHIHPPAFLSSSPFKTDLEHNTFTRPHQSSTNKLTIRT